MTVGLRLVEEAVAASLFLTDRRDAERLPTHHPSLTAPTFEDQEPGMKRLAAMIAALSLMAPLTAQAEENHVGIGRSAYAGG
jgi:hypothetical protein